MKNAFLILAHTDFEVLKLLVACLDDPRNDLFIHFDRKVKTLPEIELQHAGLTVLEKRIDVRWGAPSMIEAEYELFRTATAQGPYQYYHLLSGVDLPLKSQDYIHSYLDEHEGEEFIGYTWTEMPPAFRRKVQCWHLFPEDFKSKKGSEFAAKLTLDKDFNIQFAFESDGKFHGQKTDYKCRLCGSLLEENKNAIFCTGTTESGEPCNFTLFKTIAGHALTAKEIAALFGSGHTPLIQGFKSKKGTEFAAALKWGEGSDKGRAVFEFLHKDLPCPVCGDQLRFRSESSAQGANETGAYVCPQCGYGIPQVFYQRKFSDEEVEGLLKNKFTPVLEPFKKNETSFRAALELRDGGKLAFNKLTVEVIK